MEILEFVQLPVAERGMLFHNAESVVVFLAGMLPVGMAAEQAVEGVTGMSLSQSNRGLIRVVSVPAALVRVTSISDEAADVKAALVATLYAEVDFGVRVFATSPIYKLEPPLNRAMVCCVMSRAR